MIESPKGKNEMKYARVQNDEKDGGRREERKLRVPKKPFFIITVPLLLQLFDILALFVCVWGGSPAC